MGQKAIILHSNVSVYHVKMNGEDGTELKVILGLCNNTTVSY